MKVFVLIFSLVIAAVAIFYGIKMLRLFMKVSKWNKATAKVLSKAVVPKKLASGSRANKRVVMEYSYLISNKEYKNNKVFLVELINGERGFLPSAGEKFLEKVKDEIEIHVNPKNSEESVIYCDGLVMYIVVILMGPLSLIMGAINYYS